MAFPNVPSILKDRFRPLEDISSLERAIEVRQSI